MTHAIDTLRQPRDASTIYLELIAQREIVQCYLALASDWLANQLSPILIVDAVLVVDRPALPANIAEPIERETARMVELEYELAAARARDAEREN